MEGREGKVQLWASGGEGGKDPPCFIGVALRDLVGSPGLRNMFCEGLEGLVWGCFRTACFASQYLVSYERKELLF